MRKLYFFSMAMLYCLYASAQLEQCRPKICLIDYMYHNDASPNAQMTALQNIKPDILVTCTRGSYWGETNGWTGSHPIAYSSLNIEVYSYIAGGYEGTLYTGQLDSIDNLARNLIRIDTIAQEPGITGVFLDEVSNSLLTADTTYLNAIYERCQLHGLKLIFNPGVSTFTPWLMSRCDYILTDENYNGRGPTMAETPYMERVIVLADTINNATDAANRTLTARSYCFGFSYMCDTFTALPVWINDYLANITQSPTATPITLNNLTLSSTAHCGVQWYNVSTGTIANATDTFYTATTDGDYYYILTLQGCSDTSDTISVTGTSVITPLASEGIYLIPNPADDEVIISGNPKIQSVYISDIAGRIVLEKTGNNDNIHIEIHTLPPGLYTVTVLVNNNIIRQKLVIRR